MQLINQSIPVATRSKARVCGCSLPGIVGSNPAEVHVCFSVAIVVCCAGTSLSDGLITRPEESYRVWKVVVRDIETLTI